MRTSIQKIKLLKEYGLAPIGAEFTRAQYPDEKVGGHNPSELFWEKGFGPNEFRFLKDSWLKEGDYVILEEDFV